MASQISTRRRSPSRLVAGLIAMLWLAVMDIAGAASGPRHRGLFGGKAGTQIGFDYSPALRGAGLTWNRKLLDRWIANPTGLVPGNKMVVQLANNTQDRADILSYLELATR